MEEQIANLKTHLNLIKQMKPEEGEEQFYNLMIKAKDLLGEMHLQMAYFYYQYANFILLKLEKNVDIFNQAIVPQEQQIDHALNQIQEHFQEDSQSSHSAAKSENQPNLQNQPSNLNGQPNQLPEIVNAEAKPQINGFQKEFEEENQLVEIKQENEGIEDKQQIQQTDDDREVCQCNLEWALKIYLGELGKFEEGQQCEMSFQEVLTLISRTRSRLGDLFMLSENYERAVDQYRNVIEAEQKRQGHESKRALAELHYLIGNAFLYENKAGCQKVGLIQYIKAVNILVNHLTLIKHYDTSVFQLPYDDHYKVDRFSYLPKPLDSEEIIEIKDVISCLLDKIQDTYDQIAVRDTFEQEKLKFQQEKQNTSFKEVSKDTKVVHLGTFGRKKNPNIDSTLEQNIIHQSTAPKSLNPSKSEENAETKTDFPTK